MQLKSQTGVWLDSSKAIIVTLNNDKEQLITVKSNIENKIYHDKEGDKGSFMGSRHINNESKFNNRKNYQTEQFIKTILQKIKNSDEIYLFGPAELKLRIKHEFENDPSIASRLLAVEPADSMTNNQIVSKVRDFFSK